VFVIAHRGASVELPENTLAAFERAIEIAADYVEFDVHNDLSVTHDSPRRGLAYPSLVEVLDLCHGRIGVMVELKRPRGDTVERTLRLLRDDDVVVSFHRHAIEEVQARRPGLRTVQHVGFGVSVRRAAGGWAVGFQDERLTRRGLSRARALGLETMVYTVNDERRLLELRELGVGGVFTDDPRRALRVLRGATS
jgi:glycerophosphoryl diester phosphodiesterase